MPTYIKTKDKNGRDLHWKVLKNGKRKRVSKKIAEASKPEVQKPFPLDRFMVHLLFPFHSGGLLGAIARKSVKD